MRGHAVALGAEGRTSVNLSILPHLAPVLEEDTATWAEKNVIVNSRGSNPGPWKRGTVSAMCRPGGPLEALDNRSTEVVVLAKGAQTGGTYTSYCWLAKELSNDPSSALIVMSTMDVARKKAHGTWMPMWEDSPGLKGRIPRDRRREWTKPRQTINGSPVMWIGANSPANLASVDIRRLILDEVDKYPQGFGRGSKDRRDAKTASEAGAMELALQRIKTYQRNGTAKVFILSTPTDEQGPIWTRYLQGDQRRLFVPCWKCGEKQVMAWQSFTLDMTLAKTDPEAVCRNIRYKCQGCGALWDDEQRFAAIDAGEWRPTAIASDPKCRSYQLPSWCSKFVVHSFLARKWIGAQSSRSLLQDFINGESAEPWIHYETAIRDSMFAEVEGDYKEGETFADCPAYKAQYEGIDRFVFGGVDVQKGYLVAVFRQFAQGGDSGLVWAGDVGTFENLDELATRFNAQFVLMDQRYRTREVQEWCFAHTGYIPCAGVTTRARSIFQVNALDLDEGRSTRTGMRVIEQIGHDPDQLKDILASSVQRSGNSPRWYVPQGYSLNAKYCQQMTAERCVNGRWINAQQKANHFWDAECLALLAAVRFGVWGQNEQSDNSNTDSSGTES